MSVFELIKLLKKQNPEAKVLMQSHDQGEDETDGEVTAVSASESEILQSRCNGAVVVIS
ncbi:hypothetical protein [Pseudomonas syringae]|uniref:hypothetical protein n=1 Tax=Pseudomonas syringae TaxID=317 RepID=UPI0032D98D68